MNNDIRLLVFDWDGTLMDSEARIVASMQAAAQDANLRPPSETAVKEIIGLGLNEALSRLFPHVGSDVYPELTECYREQFLFKCAVPTRLFNGAAETLLQLRECGYHLAIATGKGRRGLDRVLRETNVTHFFDATRCSDETRSKPHPCMLFELMDELGIGAANTLMIGDTEYDMQMACAAGTFAMAVSYGVHEKERLIRYRPVGCLDHIRELADWLGIDRKPRITDSESNA